MEIILLESVKNLGKFGDIVKVTNGYGANYLIPKAKAILANTENKTYFEAKKEDLRKALIKRQDDSEQIAAALKELNLSISAKTVSSEGKLFGSITARNISDTLVKQHDITIDKKQISVPNLAIRNTGQYDILIKLEDELDVTIPLNVVNQ